MDKERLFVICPVRSIDPDLKITLESFVLRLEKDYNVYYPAWDTDQGNDATGMRICTDNLRAIESAAGIIVAWDGKSQGSLFDFGMVFCLKKLIALLDMPGLYPERTEGKSFQNMLLEYAEKYPYKLTH